MQRCYKLLSSRFPESVRVRRLRAALHEAEGKFDNAVAVYDELLKANPADAVRQLLFPHLDFSAPPCSTSFSTSLLSLQLSMKRKIAILLAQHQQAAAIKAINEYLSTYAEIGFPPTCALCVLPEFHRETLPAAPAQPGSLQTLKFGSSWSTFTLRTPSRFLWHVRNFV